MANDKYDRIDRALTREKNALDRRLSNGEISPEEYNKRVCELEQGAREEYNSPDFPDDRMY